MSDEQSDTEPEQPGDLRLFFSGGGIRSALASLGVVYYLAVYKPELAEKDSSGKHDCTWDNVKGVVSVSGGSLTNAWLLTQDTPGRDEIRLMYERLVSGTSPKRAVKFWLLVLTMTVVAVVGLFLTALSADRDLARLGLPWVTGAAVVITPSLMKADSLWPARKSALWLLSAGMGWYVFDRYFWPLSSGWGAVGSAALGLVMLIFSFLVVVGAATLVVQMMTDLVHRERTRSILRDDGTSGVVRTGEQVRDHVFVATDSDRGEPVYLAFRPGCTLGVGAFPEAAGALDSFQFSYPATPGDATAVELAVLASGRMPGVLAPIVWPRRRTRLVDGGVTGTLGSRLLPRLSGVDDADPVLPELAELLDEERALTDLERELGSGKEGECCSLTRLRRAVAGFREAQVESDLRTPTAEREALRKALLVAQQADTAPPLSNSIEALKRLLSREPTGQGHVPAQDYVAVVVDAGKYLFGNPALQNEEVWFGLPFFSGIFRTMQLSFNSLAMVDRRIAILGQYNDVWYVAATGIKLEDHLFHTFSPELSGQLSKARATARAARMLEASGTWMQLEVGRERVNRLYEEAAESIRRSDEQVVHDVLARLRAQADKVGYSTKSAAKWAPGCVASGLAAALAKDPERNGWPPTAEELCRALEHLTQKLRLKVAKSVLVDLASDVKRLEEARETLPIRLRGVAEDS
ncbi:MAG: hypothetical protein AAF480_02590 [Actinomycetota bacterium]